MKIGISVTTTPDREQVFQDWLTHYAIHCADIYLYVHIDTEHKGVSYSKNKCLSALDGCHYMFLFDDDCFIKDGSFIEKYISSGLGHACYTFDRPLLRTTCRLEATGAEQYENLSQIIFNEHETPNGCMLFFTRKAIDTVGGWDTLFKGYGYEHVNLSDRIFNSGLTPGRYIDIPNSCNLFQMADCESSFTWEDRAHISANYKLYQDNYYSKEFKAYK